MDEELAHAKSTPEESRFDIIVGHIEDIVIDDDFQDMQTQFMDKHCEEFDDNEENKLSYTPIFKDYVNMLEKYMENELLKRVPNFNMQFFLGQLDKNKDKVCEELLEMLLSFTDFNMFKQIMLEHKEYRDGKFDDLSLGLTVTSLKVSDELPPN